MEKTQIGLLLFIFFLMFLLVIALLSNMGDNQKNIVEKKVLISVDTTLIERIKQLLFQFNKILVNRENNKLIEICSKEFLSNFNLENLKVQKILCIVNAKVIEIKEQKINIEFITRNIFSEVIKFNLIVEYKNNLLKVDSIN